ncbi:type II toxin-antitoxin system RelE/ParE family toxin [uncultured Methanolobus sp.]|uniref:type II toxin-antitoxin system RelE family toxin n=1 Tax=uncultured Methanolobus sp. TaxID=218300 RepID=UPI003747C6C4
MTFEAIFTAAFKKYLKTIKKKSFNDAEIIVHSIEHIILIDPFSADTKQLQCGHYRHRVGRYRIVFDFTESNEIVFLAVDRRYSIYNKLRQRFKKC